MALLPGTRFGPYEVGTLLGKGGMGEVYRATDGNLRRQVAIKVLPEGLAQDADRLARFEREAAILAQLNHPNIAHIHSLEKSESASALVMELVEGPTLADRIAEGRVNLDEALPIAKQIADALEAAHEQGIVHRDLKPGNIKLRADGVVKMLDFGLAKAMDSVVGSDPAQSPTVTSPALTRAGLILGTPSYMSPEQACGLAVDRGTDIWAWGCVLFEMLSGERAFGGTGTTDVIASVVRAEPDWSRLPPETPPTIRRLLGRCLEKDRKRRLADIRDARFAIEDAEREPIGAPPGSPRALRRERVVWAAALLACLVGGGFVAWRSSNDRPAAGLREMRVEITTPPTSDPVSIAISPDGEKIAFVSSSRGRPMLWVRSIVTGEVRPLPGTDGASFPFWSPDSRSVGFFANERLNRIDIDGGSLRPIAFAPVGAGGTWSRDGDILYTLVPDGPISRVTDVVGQPVRHPGAEGGPRILPGFETGRGGHRFPQFLPDGRRFLYYVLDSGVRGVYVGTLDGPDRRHLFDADAAAVFVPPAEVIYVRAGTLFSQRVDPATLAFEGDAIVLADGVAVDWAGAAAVSASAAGAIVYRRADARLRQLVWVDRSGKTIGEAFPPDSANPLNPALSPDGRRLAVNRTVGGNSDIWVVDLDRRGALAKVTSAPTPDISPIWSPKDDLIVYGGSSTGSFDLWQVSTARPGEPRALLTRPLADVPLDWSRDGRFVLFRSQMDPVTGVDLWALPLDGADRTPIPVARSAADEHSGEFSPDTTWVAIESDETGRREIYLQGFPAAGTKIPLSTSGGTQPRWRPDGKELSYVAPDGQLMAVGLRFGSKGRSVEPTSPVPLFVTRVSSTPPGGSRQEYVLSPDGKRFLMNTLVEQANAPITLILRRRQ